MTQQGFDGQNLAGEFRQWRIPADWLIQIELAWLIAATLLGGYLSGLPTDNWWAWAYRTWAGGNVLGLFVLGNTAGYLTYEEVRMVLSGIFHREKVADILAKEAQAKAAQAEAEAKSEARIEARIKAMQAEVEANLRAEQAEAEAKLRAEQAEAEAKLSVMVDAAVSKAITDTVGPMAAAREAALAEYRQAVAAWYERQQAAQRAGQPFAEPPPGYDGNGGNGGGPAG